jgi:hypothetical protein
MRLVWSKTINPARIARRGRFACEIGQNLGLGERGRLALQMIAPGIIHIERARRPAQSRARNHDIAANAAQLEITIARRIARNALANKGLLTAQPPGVQRKGALAIVRLRQS